MTTLELVLIVLLFIGIILVLLFRELNKPAPVTSGMIIGKLVYDANSTLLLGVTVTALAEDGTVAASTLTAADGSYSLGSVEIGLPVGIYIIAGHKDLGDGTWLEGSTSVDLETSILTVPDLTLVKIVVQE